MVKLGLLESFLLFHGRHLQQEIPDYTSPPLEIALEATPELYRSDEIVQEARDLAAAGNCTTDGNRCHIPFPVMMNDEEQEPSKVGVIFYNGGLVDPRGYSPLAALLNQRYGIPVVMPIFASDLAFVFGTCDSGRLDFAKAEFPQVEKWVLAGHSFGGVAAVVDMWSRWNANDESAAGLALLASDVQQGLLCGDTDFSDTDLPMAQLLASNDGVLNSTRVALNRVFNSDATFYMDIYGANHQSFGNYDSSQRSEILGQTDGDVLIPDTVVWDLAAAAIANVAARTGVPLAIPTKESADPTTIDVFEGEESEDGSSQTTDRCPPGVDESPESSGGVIMVTSALLSWVLFAAYILAWA